MTLSNGNPWASQVVLGLTNLPASSGDVRDMGLIPGSGRSPGRGYGYPLQYSSLENPTDRGAWWATVLGVSKSQSDMTQQLNNNNGCEILSHYGFDLHFPTVCLVILSVFLFFFLRQVIHAYCLILKSLCTCFKRKKIPYRLYFLPKSNLSCQFPVYTSERAVS